MGHEPTHILRGKVWGHLLGGGLAAGFANVSYSPEVARIEMDELKILTICLILLVKIA
jgi:hypothetical protein